jgi:hypothetical protein
MDQIIRGATGTEGHPNNMNREDGFLLSKSWKPFTHVLKEQKQALTKDMAHTSFCPSSALGPCKDLH